MTAPLYFLVAGEPSGDRLGAALMDGLIAETSGNVRFAGVGGPMMAERGLESLFPMSELSIMGLVEVLPKLRGLFKRVDQTARAACDSGAVALITIDSPDFCLRVAKACKKQRALFPVIHYVAPSVWAWRPKRANKMARYVDHVLTLLPFEPRYMQAAGMSSDFVGHPVVAEPPASEGELRAFRTEYSLAASDTVLTVLPGSRHGEIKRIGPVFRSVVQDMLVEMPDLRIFIPSVAHRVDDVRAMFAGIDVTILDPRPLNTAESERRKKTCFTLSTAALAASGTVSLELAATRTPMVIAYRQAPVTAFMMRRLAKISTVTLVNIVSETRAVPEFLLEDCTPEAILPAIRSLLGDKTAAATQHSAEDVTMTALGEGGPPPGLRAARSVLEYLRRARH